MKETTFKVRNTGRMTVLLAVTGSLLLAGCGSSESPPNKKPPAGRSAGARPPAERSSPPRQRPTERAVPPYHESAEAAKPFPPLVPAAYFRRYPLVERAYRIAGKIPDVIAQQPCYCYCDKFAHRSLLDCYASDHAAG